MSQSESTGYARKAGEGVHIDFRGTKMTVKASNEQTEGAYSLIEMVHPPNVGPALHIHPRGAEAFYVLEGHYAICSGDRTFEAGQGDFVFIPKGVAHNYQSGLSGGKVLVISPAGLEKYFVEVAHALNIGPITWSLEQEIAQRYGQEFLDHLKHWA